MYLIALGALCLPARARTIAKGVGPNTVKVSLCKVCVIIHSFADSDHTLIKYHILAI